MSNAVSFDIITLLAANGFGTSGVDLFGMEWGVNVAKQILVMDTAGFDSPQKLQFEQPGFQILARGEKTKSPTLVYDDARAIQIFLINQPTLVTINGTDYLGFEPQGNLAGIGRDSNQRYVYSMNFWTYRNPE